MTQIPQDLPTIIPETAEHWRRWLYQDTENVPLEQKKVMGNVPTIIDISINLHSEAQRLEDERNYWRGEAGKLYSRLLRRLEGVCSIQVPFTRYRLILAHRDPPAPPILPQEFEVEVGDG